MPRLATPLTDTQVKTAKPRDKIYTLADGGGMYFLFPNQRDPTKPASNGAILAALKRMGYGGKHTGHGFRSLAMGVIQERLGYRHEVVDRQLAHASGDAHGEAYDRASFLDERRVMMQPYADYLDSTVGAVGPEAEGPKD